MVQEAFSSEFYPKVDSKARVSVPASFRAILVAGDPPTPEKPRSRMYMVYGGTNRRFVECYTMEGSRHVAATILAMPRGSKKRLVASRTFLTLSVAVEIDEDGRIVLPKNVREKMEISPEELASGLEAAFAGDGESFQLWKKSTYQTEVIEKMEEMDRMVIGDEDPSFLLAEDYQEE